MVKDAKLIADESDLSQIFFMSAVIQDETARLKIFLMQVEEVRRALREWHGVCAQLGALQT